MMKNSTLTIMVIVIALLFGENIKAQWKDFGKITNNNINSVFYLNESNVWAVGDNGTILKFDGANWTKQKLPFFTNSNLKSVYFVKDTLGWAVGEGGIILKFSQSKWSVETVYGGNDFNSVYFVDATHGWAVGTGIYNYDGIKWTEVDLGAGYHYYNSVYFTDVNNGWAAGYNGNILKWNGISWSIAATGLSPNYLNAICFTSNTNGWAAGYGCLFHFNGSSWSPVALPSEYQNVTFSALTFANANLGYLVSLNGKILKYNGTSWTKDSILAADTKSIYGNPLYGAKMLNASSLYVVGGEGFIAKYNGASWTANQTNEYKYYGALNFVDKNHGWICENSNILKYYYGKFYNDSITGYYRIYANSISMTDTLNGWAVGSGSNALKYNGTFWESFPIGDIKQNHYLNSVHMVNSKKGWIVGNKGAIFMYDGNNWVLQPTGTTKNLASVYFTDSLHGWAVGDSGIILKYSDKKWSVINSVTTENLKSVCFSDSVNGWVVGNAEVILRCNSAGWSLYKQGNKWDYLSSVKYYNNKWWITGSNKLLNFNGSSWVEQEINLGSWPYLKDIQFVDVNSGWMISSNSIFYTTNGGVEDYSGNNKIQIAGKINFPNYWTFDTVLVLHDVKIERYLTIAPRTTNGVKVLFTDDYSFSANKGFSGIGRTRLRLNPLLKGALIPLPGPIIIKPIADTYPIIFSRLDTTGGKGWKSFSASPDPNDPLDTIRLSYCYFYASRDNMATVHLSNSGVIMNNCKFQKNISGVYMSGIKSGYINNNYFENTTSFYGGLTLSNSSNLSLSGNTFKNNQYGIRIYQNSSAISFNRNSVVKNIYAGMIISNSTITINNATIGNNGGGIELNDSRADIYNALIVNNESYNIGGIKASNSVLNIVNSTIARNKANNDGGGIFYSFSNGDVFNTILWKNTTNTDTNQVYLENYGSKPNFYYCDIENGIEDFKKNGFSFGGKYKAIYNTDPKFVSPASGSGKTYDGTVANWNLDDSSVCVNNGTQIIGKLTFPDYDIADKKRVLNGAVDIGAYETSLPSFVASCSPISKSTVWAADTVKINCNILIQPTGSLTIMPGTRVEFFGPYKIIVKGVLKAFGTEVDSIKFTLHDTTKFFSNDTSKGWRGIEFDNYTGDMDYSDSSVFRYCRFEYGRYNKISYYNYGLIKAINFTKISISNCLFISNKVTEASYYGGSVIYLSRSGIKLFNNKFLYNNGPVLNCSMSELLLENNVIGYNNTDCDYGAIINLDGTECTISNNTVYNNSIKRGYILNLSSSNGSIVNNLLANNSSDSAYYYGTIQANSSNAIIANNTIVNNYNYGMYLFNSKIRFFNNIVWGNYYGMGVSSPGLGSLLANSNIDNYWGNTEYFSSIVTDTPRFVSPSAGIGKKFDGLKANWTLTQFSPCINKGSIDTSGLKLSAIDLAGKNRINGDRIDIGAYEDQGSRLYIKTQPVNIIACDGDTVEFALTTSDTAFYQWQKDGVDIPGAKSRTLKIYTASSTDEANYNCNATNAYGTVQSNNVYLLIKTAPKILKNIEDIYVGKSRKASLTIEATGSEPMQYQWYKNNVVLADKNLPVIKFENVTIDEEAFYYSKISNSCGEAISGTANIAIVPQICMVTVSNNTNRNLIVWEKNSRQVFDHYNVYREGTVSGFYQLIGNTAFNTTNIFEDATVNPKSQAYLYKITGVYANGKETDLEYCSPHKTIHLLITEGVPDGYQLDWDEYIGFPYGSYKIYKIGTNNDTSLVHTMASTTRSWTDVNETKDLIYYFVSVEKSDGCYPKGRTTTKAGSDVFGQSVSNIEDNRLRAPINISKVSSDEFQLISYPNPFTNSTSIKYVLESPAKVTIELCNVLGETKSIMVNQKQETGEHKLILDAKHLKLTPGVYTLKLRAENKVVVYKMIKK